MFRLIEVLVLILFSIQLFNANDSHENTIKKLRTELFKTRAYDTMAVPVKNWSHTITVDLDINLIKLVDLDVNSHIMTTEAWLIMSWHDEHLTWNTENYEGLDVIRVTPEEVFKPDIMLYNAADLMTMKDNMVKTNLLLYSTGLLFWVPPVVLKSMCEMDVTDWPYDEQHCFLKFGSWTHDGLSINISDHGTVSLHDYWKSQEWDIIDTRVERKDVYYECCKEPYPDITFWINVKRKTSIYHYTIFLPVTTAVVLNLLMFWFSIRSMIRFMLSSVSISLLTIILLVLGSKFGFGADTVPYSIRYVSKTIFTIGLTLIWSTIAYNLLDMNLELPFILRRVTAPAERLIFIARDDSDNIGLTNDETVRADTKRDKSFEVFIVLIDKIMFGIFFVVIISLHI